MISETSRKDKLVPLLVFHLQTSHEYTGGSDKCSSPFSSPYIRLALSAVRLCSQGTLIFFWVFISFFLFLFAPLPACTTFSIASVISTISMGFACCCSVTSLYILNHSNLVLILNENKNNCFSNKHLPWPRIHAWIYWIFCKKYICSLPTIEYKT